MFYLFYLLYNILFIFTVSSFIFGWFSFTSWEYLLARCVCHWNTRRNTI